MLKLLKDGLTWDEIAAKLPGRSRIAVYNRYYRRQGQDKAAPKSTMKEFTKEEDDVLIKTLDSGKSVAETARLLGKSHSSVTHRAAKLEEQGRLSLGPRSGRRYTVAELKLIERLRETGTRWKEIRRLHFSDRTVKQIMEGFRRYRLGKESRGTIEVGETSLVSFAEGGESRAYINYIFVFIFAHNGVVALQQLHNDHPFRYKHCVFALPGWSH